MDAIDRLGWADGISVHAYGRRIGVRTNQPAVLAVVRDLLPPGWEPCGSPLVDHLFSLRIGGASGRPGVRNFHLLYGGFTLLSRSFDLGVVMRALESHMHLYVGEYASNRVFVHAGVVGWRNRAIVLPGASGAGKTTLVTALLRAGARYYSDEYAVFDAGGFVHPFARRLSIRSADGGVARRCGPEEFGSRAGEEPLPVGLVALTNYRRGAGWMPRLLTPGQAVVKVLEHTLPAQIDPEGSLRLLKKAVASAMVVQGVRGDADETAGILLSTLERGLLDNRLSVAPPTRPDPILADCPV